MKTKLFTLLFIGLLLLSTPARAQWSSMGVTDSFNNIITTMCVDPSGNVYAAGLFKNDSSRCFVAKWNGTSWAEMGGANALAATGIINSICSDPSGNIYAAGAFTNGSNNEYLAKWDGSSWSELGGANALSANSSVFSISSDPSGNIYAVGEFTNCISSFCGWPYVAKWDGSSWSELGGHNSLADNGNWISSVCSDPAGNIYASGLFYDSTGYEYVAKYNGSTWSKVGSINASSSVGGLSVYADQSGNLYTWGPFTNSSGKYYVAKWNGSSWAELGGTNSLAANATIGCVCTDPAGNVYATGTFTNGATSSYGNPYIAKYDGSSWTELGGRSALAGNAFIYAVCSDASGTIYTGPDFDPPSGGGSTNGNSISFVAKYVSPVYTDLSDTICAGSSYTFGGHDLTAAGTYYDTLSNINGGDSIVTLHLSYLPGDSIHAQFSLQPSTTPHLWYVVNQCSGTPALSYTWSWGDGSANSTGDTPSHTYGAAGYYTVCVTVTNSVGCTSSYCDSSVYLYKDQSGQMVYINVVNQLPSGIAGTEGPVSLQLYPNPASNSLVISSANTIQTIRIINGTGEVVLREDNLSCTLHTLSVARLARGIYYIQVTGADDTAVRKLVVE